MSGWTGVGGGRIWIFEGNFGTGKEDGLGVGGLEEWDGWLLIFDGGMRSACRLAKIKINKIILLLGIK